MKLAGAYISQMEIEVLDRIAQAHQVPRSIVIRWAISAYLKRFSLPECPSESTNVHCKEETIPAVA